MSGRDVPPTIRLVNEIAAQFHHRTEEEAANEIACHVRTFWDPRMRRDLIARVERGHGAELAASARHAVELMKQRH